MSDITVRIDITASLADLSAKMAPSLAMTAALVDELNALPPAIRRALAKELAERFADMAAGG